MEEINEAIAGLRETSEGDDLAFLNELSKNAKIHALFLNLKEHPAVKIVFVKYQKDIAKCKETLATDATLFDTEEGKLKGLKLHARIDFCKVFLKFFTDAQTGFDVIKHKVDNLVKEKINDN